MAHTIIKFGERTEGLISEIIVDTAAELSGLDVPTHSVALCLEDSSVRFLNGNGDWVVFGGAE
ncbi:MAG: hypothetical protein KBT27_02100 [Prevotellaceae bacterium]|nr:hypothetical protein [Candidatus Faecinaster equi]